MTTCSAGRRVDVGEQPALELQLLRGALLHVVGVADGVGQLAGHGQVVGARARGQPELGQRRPGRLDGCPQPRLGVRSGVPGAHLESAGQEVGHPAAADHPGVHAGDGAHPVRARERVAVFQHVYALAICRISRASSGVATSAPIAVMIVTAFATSARWSPCCRGRGRGCPPARPARARRAAPTGPPTASASGRWRTRPTPRRAGSGPPWSPAGPAPRGRRTGCPCTAGTCRAGRSGPRRSACWRTRGARCRRSPARAGPRAPGSAWPPRATCPGC